MRHAVALFLVFVGIISIHALTRSATVRDKVKYLFRRYFNPRTHEECDAASSEAASAVSEISIHALTRSATPIKL